MSVVYQDTSYIFVDHCKFVNKIYSRVSCTGEIKAYELKQDLFCINSDSKLRSRKRKLENRREVEHEECSKVKEMYGRFLENLPPNLKSSTNNQDTINKSITTSEVRELARKLFESTVFEHKGINGGNNSDDALACTIKDNTFLIPPISRFFSGCVKEQCAKLSGSKFNIIVADPPWWNKYIRRLKHANDKLSYSMMYNEEIASIPVKDLLAPNSLVAVWCTNAPSNISAVKDLIFPQWGVEYLTTWYWLKVTTKMEPLCDFSAGCNKQPYERIMLGKIGDVTIPKEQLIVSVPSALHSHKPPLLELLTPYVNTSDPTILELFARYLLPNTTSIGYEPLKWQHISLYDKIS